MSYDSWKTTEPDHWPAPEQCPECGGDIDREHGCGCTVEPDCPACLRPDSECVCSEGHRSELDDEDESDGDDQP